MRLSLVFAGLLSLSVQAELPAAVKQSLQQQQLPEQSLSFIAYPLQQQGPTLSYLADRPMQPASTMKVLTSVAALELLGVDYQARTELRSFEPAQAKMTQPLVLRGMGAASFDYQQAWWLLQQAYQAGVRHIPAIWLDRSWLSPTRSDLEAPYFDESPQAYYNLIPDALFLDRAMTSLTLSADANQSSAALTPALAGVRLDNQLRVTSQACDDWSSDQLQRRLEREPKGFTLHLSGDFPANCQKQYVQQLFNRADQSRLMLQQLWQQISGQKAVPVLEHADSEASLLLATQLDRPLAEHLRHINKTSDNALVRLLYLALAQQNAHNTPELAEQKLRGWLTQLGVDQQSLVLENGSGLSRKERISPALLASVLQHAYLAPYAPELISSLPLAGTDGTLKRRLTDDGVRQQARLKTGTLRNAVALAGFVKVPGQGDWVMVAMLNHPEASAKGRPVLDSLVTSLIQKQF